MRSVARERDVSKDLFIEGAASRAVAVVVAGAVPSPKLNSVCVCLCVSVRASAGAPRENILLQRCKGTNL